MVKVYIVRKFHPVSEYNFKSYYEEAVFYTYLEAELFVKQECIEERGNFFPEIVSYTLGGGDSYDESDTWYFSNTGKLLYTTFLSEEEARQIKNIYNSFESKYSAGDFVFIKAFPLNIYSNMWKDILGFVVQCPIPLNKWISDGNALDDWDSHYVVFFINSKGCLDHTHVPEVAMQLYNLPIPDELSFLTIFSDAILNNKNINNEYLDDIWSGKIIVKKVHTFDVNKLIMMK